MRVEKPWGYEIRWALNEKYIGKILRIEPGQKLSRQYHQQKDESIYVLDGKLVLEIGEAMRFLGLQQSSFFTLIKKYKVDDYFSELDIDNDDKV